MDPSYRSVGSVALGLVLGCAGKGPAAPATPQVDMAPPVAAEALVGTPDAFARGCRDDVARAGAEITRLKGMTAAEAPLAVLAAYDNATGLLLNASGRAGLARNVHPDPALRTAAEECEAEAQKQLTELSLDGQVYAALSRLDLSSADEATRYYLKITLRDFRHAGVDRDAKTRERVKQLNQELVRLGQEFQRNINNDVRKIEIAPAELRGLPDDYRRAHAPKSSGKVEITTVNTDYVPFLTYAESERARAELWRLYRLRGHPQNQDVLLRMLARRHELATLLGYPNWADYVTADKMIGSGTKAADFIAKITTAADARARKDYEALLSRKRRDQPGAERVNAWESMYLSERVKSEQYHFDAQSVRPYFAYEAVERGILDLTSRMFGLAFRRLDNPKVWHPDVCGYDVLDARTQALIGRIYLDMFPREGKFKHYAQFRVVSGQAGRRYPEAVLVCNFPKPTPGDPETGLMEHSEVKTFLHEFGHLLHHVLGGHTRWAGISGVATEWDFVEAPSQMLEEWAWDPNVLQLFARHYRTGEPIPAELCKRMKAADEFGKGLGVRQQMFYAAVSLRLHDRAPDGFDIAREVAKMQEQYTPFRYVDGTYFHESFGHLDEYSAIYYTYMWSLVIAKDLFTVFREQGLLSPVPAEHYRKAILEPGGSKPAALLVHDFLGRDYDFRAYESWLNAG
jgi:thimet oligopeptidase